MQFIILKEDGIQLQELETQKDQEKEEKLLINSEQQPVYLLSTQEWD